MRVNLLVFLALVLTSKVIDEVLIVVRLMIVNTVSTPLFSQRMFTFISCSPARTLRELTVHGSQ